MLGVICAMDIEAEGLISMMKRRRKINCIGFTFTVGIIKNKRVIVALSGIGKCNAAAVAAMMISNFKATEIINLGICGGNLKVGTTIAADSVVQYDFDTTAFGDELGQLDGFDSPYIICSQRIKESLCGDVGGVIASGDKFIASEKEANFLAEHFGAVGFDMESGAVAQICAKANVEFAVLRVVSDGGDATQYADFKVQAAKKGIEAVKRYLSAK